MVWEPQASNNNIGVEGMRMKLFGRIVVSLGIPISSQLGKGVREGYWAGKN